MRLDRALALDLGRALRSRPVQLYLVLQIVAAVVFVTRRGQDTVWMLVLVYLALAIVAFLAWWAGRHRLAHPRPDPVPAAGAKASFALVVGLGWGLVGFGVSLGVGFLLVLVGVGGWVWAFVRNDGLAGVGERLARDPRPFVPLYLFIALPRLLAIGPVYLLGVVIALPSGIVQQLLLLVGLFGPLEAWSGRPAWAALGAAAVFAVLHVPIVMPQNGDDIVAATANAAIFQLSVGFIAVMAYRRHRAAVPIGIAHGLTIA
jgi:hypothetical protein